MCGHKSDLYGHFTALLRLDRECSTVTHWRNSIGAGMSVLSSHRRLPALLLLVVPYIELLLLPWRCLPHSASAFVLEPTYPNRNRFPRYSGRESAATGPTRSRPVAGVGKLRAALDIAPAGLECGSVLWASPENYAHSTHQVSLKSDCSLYNHHRGLYVTL